MIRFLAGFICAGCVLLGGLRAESELPFETRFKGVEKFQALRQRAYNEDWAQLKLGDRIVAIGRALCGTPYKSYTLEIDDHIEAPSVNLYGLDCWTFFEVSLAFARMLELPKTKHTPNTLLDFIELDRYRDGKCDGDYLSRLHYLADWLFNNVKGGLVKDMTRELGGVRLRRECREMTVGWRHYRYLKNSPSLRERIKGHEARISKLPVYHIPKWKVDDIEPQLQNGDIIGITSKYQGAFCSHVGLAYRDAKGVLRFMHASSKYKKVVVDQRLSHYLYDFRNHAGILVARPLGKNWEGN